MSFRTQPRFARNTAAVSIAAAGLMVAAACAQGDPVRQERPGPGGKIEVATFAGGCFWCVEAAFDKAPGVITAVSGYTGGKRANPTYRQVAAGETSHLEAVQVRFDPGRISYDQLLDLFWRQVDPTDAGGQFADRGAQYMTRIFVHDAGQRQIALASRERLQKSGRFARSIVTPVEKAGPFYRAEAYHQDYHRKNPTRYTRYRDGSGRTGFLRRVWGAPPGAAKKKYRKPDRAELRRRLTPLQYRVTQEGGTERPFANPLWNHKAPGIYVDVVTGEPLFSSRDKFDSGSGWPSFTRPIAPKAVVTRADRSLGASRTEVRSRHGDSHLGHVFRDGPRPTGLRYCINSAALRFVPRAALITEGLGEYHRTLNKKD